MVHCLVVLNNLHELLVHLPLLLILFSCDFPDVLVLLGGQLLLAKIFSTTLLPNFVQLFFFFRNVLLSVEEAGRGQYLVYSLNMSPCTVFSIKLWPHINERVSVEVHLGEIAVVTELDPGVLEVIVGEETGVDVLAQEFSQFKDQLVLQHLKVAKNLIDQGNKI